MQESESAAEDHKPKAKTWNGRRRETMEAAMRAQVHNRPPDQAILRGRRRLGANRVWENVWPSQKEPGTVGPRTMADLERQAALFKIAGRREHTVMDGDVVPSTRRKGWATEEYTVLLTDAELPPYTRRLRRQHRETVARIEALRGRRCGAVRRRELLELAAIRLKRIRKALSVTAKPLAPTPEATL